MTAHRTWLKALVRRCGIVSGWLLLASISHLALAAADHGGQNFTNHWLGYAAVAIFVLAYALVVAEDTLGLRKSKPVIVAAGIIWILVAVAYTGTGQAADVSRLLRHNLLEYAELMLFLLAAMTFINTLEERNVFRVIRSRLIAARLSLRAIYWLTGLMAFLLSPIADNLTTALVLGSVVRSVAGPRPAFVTAACVNVVVAANAGGAFSPFGDITTLMVWQAGLVDFGDFLRLFPSALLTWLVPAFLISLTVPRTRPVVDLDTVSLKRGAVLIGALFLATIAGTVWLHQSLHLPAFLGMMTGLGLLKVYGHFIRRHELNSWPAASEWTSDLFATADANIKPAIKPFDIFISMKRVEWDTLMFFYGVMLSVGGLAALGYMALLSSSLYGNLDMTAANILVGLLSAIIDNIPIMFAVLTMQPDMPLSQWLLVTLTTGVGGSLLAVGSAAGVALMGLARKEYTFLSHLKWSWAVALGYAAGILLHLFLNGAA